MRRLIIVLLVAGILIGSGCSTSIETTQPADRESQIVMSGISPALPFQLNAWFALGENNYGRFTPLDLLMGEMGIPKEDVLAIMEGASLVNACRPLDVEVPEWDEWLLATTIDVDVPEWDEWLELEVPEWDEWLQDIEVPEWDEWLLRFEGKPIRQ